MNAARVKNMSGAGGVGLLLTFLFVQQRPADPKQNDEFTHNLLRMKQLDAEVTRDVLSSRYDLVNTYDALVQKLEAIRTLGVGLERIPSFISGHPREQLQRLLTDESKLLFQKADLIEKFKSTNAILKNSLQYFPLLVAEGSQAGVTDQMLQSNLAALLRDVLLYNFQPHSDSDGNLEVEIEAVSRDAGRESRLSAILSSVRAHARTIIKTKPELDRLTEELMTLPTSAGVDGILNAYIREYDRALGINDMYRLFLYLCAVFLLGFGLKKTVGLVKSRSAVERSNQDLNEANDDLLRAKSKMQSTNESLELILKELRIAQERYELAVRGANDGLWDWDLKTGEVYFSPRWKEMLGFGPEEFANSEAAWSERLHPEDRERVQQEWIEHFANRLPVFESEHRMLHNDGTYRWMLSRGMAVRAPDGQAQRMAGSQTDITGNKSSDPLTGLANRLLFNERLSRIIGQTRPGDRDGYAVLFLDVDRFKIVNDSLGHLAGDSLLQQIADRLRTTVRSSDSVGRLFGGSTVARLGGDEFAILVEHLNDLQSAQLVAEGILTEFARPFKIAGRELVSTFSVGVAVGSPDYHSPEDVLRDADIAMYEAKTSGKGRAVVFDQGMRARAVERMEVEAEIRAGIERQEFKVFYQPKVDLDSGRILGFEALVRWSHSTRGLMPPAYFIPIAEETGLIVPLGYWVLTQACTQLKAWHRFDSDRKLTVSVNISARQFAEPDLVERLAEILNDSGLSPGSLDLEITESIAMQDPEATSKTLCRLKMMGIGLNMDDFGTGYSSLSYLQRFPFDALKIDRSFVAGLGKGSESRDLIKVIVEMAKTFNMRVVAEGIESESQVADLKNLGCQEGQGYLFSKPLNAFEAEAMITDDNGERVSAHSRRASAGLGKPVSNDLQLVHSR